ncbi:hypothetical protein ACLOJK_008066 [Asimina triloba]
MHREDQIKARGNNAARHDEEDARAVKRGADRSLSALKGALVAEEGVREREGCNALGSARRQEKLIIG